MKTHERNSHTADAGSSLVHTWKRTETSLKVWDYFQLWINKLLQRVCGRRKACCCKVSGVCEHVHTQTASPSRGAERRQPAAARRWWRPGGRAADRPTCGSAGPGPALREQPGNNQSINVLQTPRGDIRADVMSEST